MGQVVRGAARSRADTVDSGLLSMVEHKEFNKNSPRYNAGLVGIQTDTNVDNSPPNNRNDSTRIDALNDLIANLSSGSDRSSNSSNNNTAACQVLTSSHSILTLLLFDDDEFSFFVRLD